MWSIFVFNFMHKLHRLKAVNLIITFSAIKMSKRDSDGEVLG